MATVLETFENTPFTGSAAIEWLENDGGVTWSRSTLHVTQGSFTWECVIPGTLNTQFIIGTGTGSSGLDFSAYTGISLDIYVSSIDAGEHVELTVTDTGFTNTIIASSVNGATGATTLTCDFSTNPMVDKTQVILTIAMPGVAAATYYIDNLQGLGGGGGTPIAVFAHHLRTQGIS